MSSMQQPFMAGQSQAKSEEWNETEKETANNATQSVKESTHEAKQEAPSFLRQTGEQMMNMAQGAVDTVKNTLGMNSDKK